MEVQETELPGVGKKHTCIMEDGSCLIVLTHNTGKREIYHKSEPDSDAEKLLSLSDQEARTLGNIIEGVFFHPVKDESIKTNITEETVN